MAPATLLALIAASEWGVSGLLSKMSAERHGPTPTLIVAQGTGLVLVGLASLLLGEGNWSPSVALPILALGLLNLTGFWALYRALEDGPVSLVEPLVSTSPALTVLLAVLLLQETLPATGWMAVGGILLGILLLAFQGKGSPAKAPSRLAPGTAWALWTFVTLGAVTFLLKIFVPLAGPTFTVFLLRLGAMLFLLPLAFTGRIHLPLPQPRAAALLPVGVGALDTSGFILFNLAILEGSLTVATVLSNLYVLVAVVLAWIILRERPRIHQGLGIAVAVTATVVLLAILP